MDDQSILPRIELMAHSTGSMDPANYVVIGKEFFEHFKSLCDLKPHERVLDLGCGSARMALPMLEYLTPRGGYDGIDIHKPNIDWASATITPKYPHFRFHHADVRNTTYNPNGPVLPHEYRLPFEDETIDFIFLASVFTHMLPPGMRNYLAEISRVLRIGGRCLITFFLLDDAATKLIRAGKSEFEFPYHFGTSAVRDCNRPEDVIGHRESHVRKLYRGLGLEIKDIHYGNWSGRTPKQIRDGAVSGFQDMVIATKVRPGSRSAARTRLTESFWWWMGKEGKPRFRETAEFKKAA
jgi:ubiquinone/menaquinone biosynthesis C-methylase UbiE